MIRKSKLEKLGMVLEHVKMNRSIDHDGLGSVTGFA